MSKIQAVLSYNAMDYIASNHTSFQQVKAINAISSCRTSNAGSHTLSCECGHEKIVFNSCSNRHCPTCGGFSKELWIQKQQESLLPSHYFRISQHQILASLLGRGKLCLSLSNSSFQPSFYSIFKRNRLSSS